MFAQWSLFFVITVVTLAASSPLLDSRIVGGHEAEDGKYPYQVSIKYYGRHYCGGSIINKRYILTAAHCTKGVSEESLRIFVGTNSLRETDGDSYAVESIKALHFNTNTYVDDVAVLRTTKDIIFNDRVQPINITDADYREDKHPATLTGWGRLYANGPSPIRLQVIELNIHDHKSCNDTWYDAADIKIQEGHICTLTKRGEGACNGDSGGPLVANGVQVGIVSFGMPCGRAYPDVFTRVYHYRDWIKKNSQL